MNILIPVLIVAAIGLVAGVGLALASHFMAVPVDERVQQVRGALPGANCGACGYSGCDGYAAAVAAGDAQPTLCAPGGADTAAALAQIMGVDAGPVAAKTAVVHCKGSAAHTGTRFEYRGISSCAAANLMHAGPGKCAYGCIGLGDCAAVCEYDAISVQDVLAAVIPLRCKGCMKCVSACPKGRIGMIPAAERAVVRCKNSDRGAQTRKACDAGCIGCMKCVKVCETGAVTVEHFLARIDPERCTGCGKCEEVCPQRCISVL